MSEVRLAVRSSMSREGLIEMLQHVFSDNDTNGSNGPEYFRLDKDKPDDKIMEEIYSDETFSEAIVIEKYVDWYFGSMESYCRWQDYDILYDDKKKAIAIAYSYV